MTTGCCCAPSASGRPARTIDGAPEIGEIYPDAFDVRHFRSRNLPQRWAPWECARLIGDMFTDKLRFPCPAATMLCLVYPDPQAAASGPATSSCGRRASRTEVAPASCRSSRDQSAEVAASSRTSSSRAASWSALFYGVTTFSPMGQGDAQRARRSSRSTRRRAGTSPTSATSRSRGCSRAMPMTLAERPRRRTWSG